MFSSVIVARDSGIWLPTVDTCHVAFDVENHIVLSFVPDLETILFAVIVPVLIMLVSISLYLKLNFTIILLKIKLLKLFNYAKRRIIEQYK